MRETVGWYLEHRAWCERITSGVYRRERLGLAAESAPGAPPKAPVG
jgi:dTDP-glucose 4,6-dehydratase